MRHIDERGGWFITVLPRSRKEDGLFRRWLINGSTQWEPIAQREHPRLRDGPPDIILAMESPLAEPEGFRILWFFSSHKMQRDADWRQECLRKALEELEAFKTKLQGPKCRYHTKKGVTDYVDAILAKTQTTTYTTYQVTSEQEIKYHTPSSVASSPANTAGGRKRGFILNGKVMSQKSATYQKAMAPFP